MMSTTFEISNFFTIFCARDTRNIIGVVRYILKSAVSRHVWGLLYYQMFLAMSESCYTIRCFSPCLRAVIQLDPPDYVVEFWSVRVDRRIYEAHDHLLLKHQVPAQR